MFKDRLNKVKQLLTEEKLDAVLVSSHANIVYLTGYSNFSKDEREAYLIIGKDFQYIVTDARYTEAVKKDVPHFTLFERGAKYSTEDLFKKLKNKIKKFGIEEDNLTVSEHKIVKKYFKNLKHFEIGILRSIKEKEETEKIENAASLGDRAFQYLTPMLKAGISEKEIAREIENFFRNKGAENSFPTIVAFGKNSSTPHHQSGDNKLKKGDFVLIDFGAKFENYCSDMTRTFIFGEPSNKQKEIHKIVFEAQQKAVDYINRLIKAKQKIKASEVDKVARDYIISKGYSSIPHSLGHGIGLEVHEYPYLSVSSEQELKLGMVFSIEPGIYIEGFGGVRIEDLYLIGKSGLKQLTKSNIRL